MGILVDVEQPNNTKTTESMPSETSATADTEMIERDKNVVRAKIICTIEPEFIVMVSGCNEAREV